MEEREGAEGRDKVNKILSLFLFLIGIVNQAFIACSEYWHVILSAVLFGLGYLFYRGYTPVDVLLFFISLANWLIGEIVAFARWVIFEKIEIVEDDIGKEDVK